MADPAVLQHRTSGNVLLLSSDAPLPPQALGRALSRDDAPWQARTGRALGRMLEGHSPLDDDVPPTHELARLAPLWGRVSQSRPDQPVG
jgi:hypothetical protein